MQDDVDYSVCKDDKKCKNQADRKMVKAKQKLGLVSKNRKGPRVKK